MVVPGTLWVNSLAAAGARRVMRHDMVGPLGPLGTTMVWEQRKSNNNKKKKKINYFLKRKKREEMVGTEEYLVVWAAVPEGAS